jgi:hypothetical protein
MAEKFEKDFTQELDRVSAASRDEGLDHETRSKFYIRNVHLHGVATFILSQLEADGGKRKKKDRIGWLQMMLDFVGEFIGGETDPGLKFNREILESFIIPMIYGEGHNDCPRALCKSVITEVLKGHIAKHYADKEAEGARAEGEVAADLPVVCEDALGGPAPLAP